MVVPDRFRLRRVLTVTGVTCNVCYMTDSNKSRRDELLDATVAYLLRQGVADLSLRPLAAAIGTKARMLIYHFGSRDALLAEAMSIVRQRIQHTFVATFQETEGSVNDMVVEFWKWAVSRSNERYLRLIFEVQGLALQNPDAYGGYMRGSLESWITVVTEKIDRKLPLARRRVLATLAIGVIDGLLLDYLSTGDLKRTTRAARTFARHFERDLV
jgi:AcrR family transcriptional regulator